MELNANSASDLVVDSNEEGFMADVIEASQTTPIIVDFWAPWCGPCKTLGPALEAAVQKRGGKVKMVKVNIDENQAIASQLRIQSIPTVYAFVDGQPVDGFQGAQSPAQIEAFLDKVLAAGPASPLDEALDQADALVEAGEHDAASQYYGMVLQQEPQNFRAIIGLATAMVELGDLDKAKELLANLTDDDQAKADALKTKISMLEAAENAGPVDELLAKIETNPDDHQTRLDAATALFGVNRAEEALDQLLESFRRDREWNDGAAKAQLLKTFEAMDTKDPALLKARRKFSGMVFM